MFLHSHPLWINQQGGVHSIKKQVSVVVCSLPLSSYVCTLGSPAGGMVMEGCGSLEFKSHWRKWVTEVGPRWAELGCHDLVTLPVHVRAPSDNSCYHKAVCHHTFLSLMGCVTSHGARMNPSTLTLLLVRCLVTARRKEMDMASLSRGRLAIV